VLYYKITSGGRFDQPLVKSVPERFLASTLTKIHREDTMKTGKICTGCNIWKEYKEFYIRHDVKDGRGSHCKQCRKNYRDRTKETIKEKSHQYYLRNEDKICKQTNEYKKNHKDEKKAADKIYYKKPAKYDTFAHQISWCEDIRRDPKNNKLLQVKCYESGCKEWFNPTNLQVINRLQALDMVWSGESHFYCSEECKKYCSIYNQKDYPMGHKPDYSRELQKPLRRLVIERDNYECQRCGSKESLICHHIEPVKCNPIMSADVDNCIILCTDCHELAHSQEGCKKS